MMSDSDDRSKVDQVHLYLDGELSGSNAAAFETDLRDDVVLENRVTALRGITQWFEETRSRAPSSLLERIESAIRADAGAASTAAAETAAPAAVEVPPRPVALVPPPNRRRRLLAWSAPALAAAAAIAIFILPNVLKNSTTVPASPGSVQAESELVRYVFEYRTEDAQQVCLAGDFNNWKVCDARLERVGENLWSIALELPRGLHEYMFVVDGRWQTDPNAALHSDDGFGNKNAVLHL